LNESISVIKRHWVLHVVRLILYVENVPNVISHLSSLVKSTLSNDLWWLRSKDQGFPLGSKKLSRFQVHTLPWQKNINERNLFALIFKTLAFMIQLRNHVMFLNFSLSFKTKNITINTNFKVTNLPMHHRFPKLLHFAFNYKKLRRHVIFVIFWYGLYKKIVVNPKWQVQLHIKEGLLPLYI
jgi:hypothetical protein